MGMEHGTAAVRDLARRALRQRRRLQLVYVDASGVITHRTVEVIAVGADRFLAWCLLRDDYRSFLYERTREAALTGAVAGNWPHLQGALARGQWLETVPVAPTSGPSVRRSAARAPQQARDGGTAPQSGAAARGGPGHSAATVVGWGLVLAVAVLCLAVYCVPR